MQIEVAKESCPSSQSSRALTADRVSVERRRYQAGEHFGLPNSRHWASLMSVNDSGSHSLLSLIQLPHWITRSEIILHACLACRERASTAPASARPRRACLPLSAAGSRQGLWRLPR